MSSMQLGPCSFFHPLTLSKQTQDLTFASVHDSYWTHASSIDKMSEIIRDTFIALHSSDVLGKLQFEVSLLPFHIWRLHLPDCFLSSSKNAMRDIKLPSPTCAPANC